MLSFLASLTNTILAQTTGDNERYNLAVYATGLQNDQPISTSLLTVVQNKTITKLTGEGNYRLIERSNEFLRQIQNEQVMQQSGEVADGQIAEIGAGLGAQKICVVSITIIEKYLYIATRIVDVATKTSYESGDAQVSNYKSNNIPLLTQTLDRALNNMMAASIKTKAAPVTPTIPSEKPKQAKTTSDVPTQQEASPKSDVTIQRETAPKSSDLSSDSPAQTETTPKSEKAPSNVPTQPEMSDVSSQQSGNLTVAEVRAEKERARTDARAEKEQARSEFKDGFKDYKKKVIKEKGGFLEINSLAYKKYRSYKANMISGAVMLSIGTGLFIGGITAQGIAGHDFHEFRRVEFPDYDFDNFSYSTFEDYCINHSHPNYFYDYDFDHTLDGTAIYYYDYALEAAIRADSYYISGTTVTFHRYDFWEDNTDWTGIWVAGLPMMVTGLIQLCCLNHPLKKSYNYYINGDQRTVSWQVTPYYGGNNTFGAGLSLRF